MEFPILAAERSHMPKYGVVTGSSLCQSPPSAGSLLRTSSEVRLVFHLWSLGRNQTENAIKDSYPVITEQSLRLV